jgi:hypothetical protein
MSNFLTLSNEVSGVSTEFYKRQIIHPKNLRDALIPLLLLVSFYQSNFSSNFEIPI